MIAARFRRRVPPDTWVNSVSRSFPKATFRLLSGIRQGDTAIELGESYSSDPMAVYDAALEEPSIESVEHLEMTERRSFTKYETADTGLYALFRAASMPPEFPITVRNGWAEFDFTGTREGFDRLMEILEGSEYPADLVSLVESQEGGQLLTVRQREVLEVALREGYFAVPRECTLTDLAEILDIDKSTASEIVRRGQARLVKRQLIGPGGNRPDRR